MIFFYFDVLKNFVNHKSLSISWERHKSSNCYPDFTKQGYFNFYHLWAAFFLASGLVVEIIVDMAPIELEAEERLTLLETKNIPYETWELTQIKEETFGKKADALTTIDILKIGSEAHSGI